MFLIYGVVIVFYLIKSCHCLVLAFLLISHSCYRHCLVVGFKGPISKRENIVSHLKNEHREVNVRDIKIDVLYLGTLDSAFLLWQGLYWSCCIVVIPVVILILGSTVIIVVEV